MATRREDLEPLLSAALEKHLPGVGRLILQAITNRDIVVVRDVVTLLAAMVVLINLGVDLLYAAIDPRLKSSDV